VVEGGRVVEVVPAGFVVVVAFPDDGDALPQAVSNEAKQRPSTIRFTSRR